MKAPKAPDPYATAAAQTTQNINSASAQAAINMVDQYNPYGNVVYNQKGYVNVAGQNVPQYTATTTLSPVQQMLLDQSQMADMKTNAIGLRQIDKIDNILSTPFNVDQAASDKYNDMARTRLDPMWQQRQADFEQQMVNRGVRPGSEAYTDARRTFDQGRNDAYNSMWLQGRGQAVSEAQLQRQQPINEIEALINGQQLTNPTTSLVQTPQESIPAPDLAGMIYKNYDAKTKNYESTMGGLFGLGSALIGGGAYLAKGSDRRIKKDIVPIATLDNGLTVYRYTYLTADEPEYGLMAQEVQAVRPEAVIECMGILMVDYSKAVR